MKLLRAKDLDDAAKQAVAGSRPFFLVIVLVLFLFYSCFFMVCFYLGQTLFRRFDVAVAVAFVLRLLLLVLPAPVFRPAL